MKEIITNGSNNQTPMLFSVEPQIFWTQIRQIVREEIAAVVAIKQQANITETPGLTKKPLYKIAEICTMFQITKPTIYDWVKHGKLKPYKIRSRVYFLWQDIQKLIEPVV